MSHVSIRGLTFGWPGGQTVLDDITLSVNPGEFCALVGPSGCGKSTLLRLVAGLETPTAGSASVNRMSPGRPSTTLVFQDHGVFPWMRVADNVGYALAMRGVPADTRAAAVRRWLEATRLSGVADAWPHTLSGGMRQRVAVARALANEPEVLLMDEPFAALDELTRARLQVELQDAWRQAGSTVLLVTHSLSEAVILADRVFVFSSGGRVREVLAVPLPRPRDPYTLRGVAAFGERVQALYTLLQDVG